MGTRNREDPRTRSTKADTERVNVILEPGFCSEVEKTLSLPPLPQMTWQLKVGLCEKPFPGLGLLGLEGVDLQMCGGF